MNIHALMKTFDEGAEIEYKGIGESDDKFRLVLNPKWDFDKFFYRIKGNISLESWNMHRINIIAWWDGADIEYKGIGESMGAWTLGTPYWSTVSMYRVVLEKPKPIQDTGGFRSKVHEILSDLEELLVSKNKKYGNSALEPKRIFSSANPTEQIKVRIDDKLSRVSAGTNDNEDTVQDLMGYLVLLKIAEGNNEKL